MKTNWTKGLLGAKKEEVIRDFHASAVMRARLQEILKEKIESLRTSVLSPEMYSSPAWAHMQADAVGYERAMKEVISLIISDKMSKND